MGMEEFFTRNGFDKTGKRVVDRSRLPVLRYWSKGKFYSFCFFSGGEGSRVRMRVCGRKRSELLEALDPFSAKMFNLSPDVFAEAKRSGAVLVKLCGFKTNRDVFERIRYNETVYAKKDLLGPFLEQEKELCRCEKRKYDKDEAVKKFEKLRKDLINA